MPLVAAAFDQPFADRLHDRDRRQLAEARPELRVTVALSGTGGDDLVLPATTGTALT